MSIGFNEAEGRPVIAADSAEDIGEVKGFIVDTTATRVEAVHVSGRGRKAEIVPWSSIRSFGADAVIVEVGESAARVSSDHEKQAAKGNIVLRKARVLTTGGFEIGEVDDAMFDESTGDLTAVVTDRGRIEGGRLHSLGSYALVVDPD